MEDKKNRLMAVLKAVQEISAEHTLEYQLNMIAQKAIEIAECERCSIFLIDEEKEELWSKVATGLEEQIIRVPLAKGIVGHCGQTGEIINIEDAYQDARFFKEQDSKTGFRTRSILAIPFKNETNAIIGVLQLINKQGGIFNKEDEDIVSIFAAQIAVSIQTARGFESLKTTEKKLVDAYISIDREHQDLIHRIQRGRKFLILGICALFIFIIGFIIIPLGFKIFRDRPQALPNGDIQKKQDRETGPEQHLQIPVADIVKAEKNDILSEIVLTCKLAPGEIKTLTSSVNGRITDMLYGPGDFVEAGKIVLKIDEREIKSKIYQATANFLKAEKELRDLKNWTQSPDVLQAQRNVRLAEMNMDDAKSKWDTAGRLFERGIASKDELDSSQQSYRRAVLELEAARQSAQTALSRGSQHELKIAQSMLFNAKTELDELKQQLAKVTIRAPISGVILESSEGKEGKQDKTELEIGSQVQSGAALLRIGDISMLKMNVLVDEIDINKIRYGQAAQVWIDAIPNKQLNGRVEYMAPNAQVINKLSFFEVSILIREVPQEIRKLIKVGMSGTARITIEKQEQVITVPLAAVNMQGATGMVTKIVSKGIQMKNKEGMDVIDARIVVIPVVLGISNEFLVEIKEGLLVDDEVVQNM